MSADSVSSLGVSLPAARDPKYIRENLIKKDQKLYTKEKLVIEIPKKYEDKDLLELKESVFFYGVCAFIMNNVYSVGRIPAIFETRPFSITEIIRDEVGYYRMYYPKNSIVIENTEVALRDTLTYGLFDLMVSDGKIPWFIGYEDLSSIFWNTRTFAGTGWGKNPLTNEIIAAYLTRTKDNLSEFFRQNPKSQGKFSRGDFGYVGLDDVFHSAPTNLNRIAGNYFNDGLISALLTEAEEASTIEKVVRR